VSFCNPSALDHGGAASARRALPFNRTRADSFRGRARELDHRLTPVLSRSAPEYYGWVVRLTLGGHAFPASAIGRRARDA
jgi:hypothetical protein